MEHTFFKVNGIWRVWNDSGGGYYIGIKTSTKRAAKEQLKRLLQGKPILKGI